VDKVRVFIDGVMDLYKRPNWDETLEHCLELVGFDWMREKAFENDILEVHSEEFEMRSALEFLRPELNVLQLGILEKWDALYRKWRDEGVLYTRYEAAEIGSRGMWQEERAYAEKRLGRKIPPSHWWYWPPDEEKQD